MLRRIVRVSGMRCFWGAMLALFFLSGTARIATAGNPQPTVVELFTSQGCSSCPPANANLARLSDRPSVLALSFAVTYWDRLGWKDTFGRPDFTDRQIAYERNLGHDGPFTPQIVVDGRADVVGNVLGPIESLIAASRRPNPPTVSVARDTVAIGAGDAPAAGADVWLVRYDPRVVDVAVRRGENSGRTLPHKNVVHDLLHLGRWMGAAVEFRIAPVAAPLRTAVLVQKGGGPILAAASDANP